MLKLTLAVSALLAATVSAAPQALASCSVDKLTTAMKSCDSLVDISQIRCENTECHKALHVLTDPEYIACYEELKLGSKSDLAKYKELDDFCHGEGSDPTDKDHAEGSDHHDHDHEGSGHDDHDHDHDHDHDGSKNATSPSVTSAPATVPTPAPASSATAVACAASAVSLAVGVATLAL